VARPMRGMGRGLDAILSSTVAPELVGLEGGASSEASAGGASGDALRELPLELIVANERQPRKRFEPDALAALAASLAERGVIQPVLVRPRPDGKFELVAGERRVRAARIAGLETMPALVRERADAEALELALIENMAREDLNPVEEALACAALIEELDLTREEVGRRVGRSRVAVSNLMRLLDLPDEVLDLLAEGTLSEGHGRALLLAEDHGARVPLARAAVAESWPVRTLEARARESNGEQPRVRITARRGGTAPHPDQEQAAHDIEEMLTRALGVEVRASAKRGGGYRVELSLESPQAAVDLAGRLRRRAPA
jgi:ParB family transcriptional regulator, chromosome partitioning protein